MTGRGWKSLFCGMCALAAAGFVGIATDNFWWAQATYWSLLTLHFTVVLEP